MNSQIISSPSQWERLFAFMRQINLEKPIEVRWGAPRRSNKQNRYLWKVVYPTMAEGLSKIHNELITKDHVHELCKKHFMPRITVPGVGQDIPMSTTELCRSGNENSFQDYVIQIQALGAVKGIFIPDPNEMPSDYAA